MADFKFVKHGYVFLYSSIIISKIVNCAVFSHSRDLERLFKNKMFLERSSPLIRHGLFVFCFVFCFFCFLCFGVANRQSWDEIQRAQTNALALAKCLFNGINGGLCESMVLACQVGAFHLTLTQINSEMNCIAKNKYPESQNAEVTTWSRYHCVSRRATT